MAKMKNKHFFLLVMKTVLACIFLVATTAVILSAAGYRLQLEDRSLVQTAMIVVKSLPKGATLTVNGKVEEGSTSWRVGGLQPGVYSVVVEKDGYRTWEQTVQVDPGQTALFEDVVLFSKEPVVANIDGKQNEGFVSRLTNSISDNDVVANGVELHYLGRLVTRLSSPISNARLYPDNAHIAYICDGGFWVVDLDGSNNQRLFDVASNSPYVFLNGGRQVLFQENDLLKTATIW